MNLIRLSTPDMTVADGRTITGLAVPYGEWTDIVDVEGAYREQFAPGTFERSIRERGDKIKLLALHDGRSFPIGKAISLREDPEGLYAEFRLAETERGEEALSLVRDGIVDGLSVGFSPLRSDWSADRSEVIRREARLNEISLVGQPAYDDARVLALREDLNIPTLSPADALDRWLATGGK